MEKDQLIYDRLTEVACAGTLIAYPVLAARLGLDFGCPSDRSAITEILKVICYQETAAGRPLLPAVAVSMEVGYPVMGFFLLARELGLNLFDDDRSFFYYELNRVHAYWKWHFCAPEPRVDLAIQIPAAQRLFE